MKSIFILNGLDCPNCAEKIRHKTEALENVISSEMDFINKKLCINHERDESELLNEVKEIVHRLEPDVGVTLAGEIVTAKIVSHKTDIIRIFTALVLFAVSFFVKTNVAFVLLVTAYIISGFDVIKEAVRNLFKKQPFDENLLMTVASIGAMLIGEPEEGVAVMIFYQVGELFQKIAVEKSRRSVKSLLELKTDSVDVVTDNIKKTVSPENVNIGDVIEVKSGERFALDGILISERATVDTSALTGESLPVEYVNGDTILSGSINQNRVVRIKVTERYENSTVSKLMKMIEDSSLRKSDTEKLITRFARVYTPFVLLCALLLATIPTFVSGFENFGQWIYRALVFLVVSCPCSLVISVPLTFFAGIGCASRNGILIKGAKFIESLSKCRVVAFDKTGTITKGTFSVQKTEVYDFDENEMLCLAGSLEQHSDHPVAKAIATYFNGELYSVEEVTEIAGCGVSGTINGEKVICANSSYLKGIGIETDDDEMYTTVCVAKNGRLIGKIHLGDSIKQESVSAVKKLKACGVLKTAMLTGDKKQIAEMIGKEINADDVMSQLLPHEKVSALEKLISEKIGVVAYAGDGINDAPVIARADVGIAMGAIGSDCAVEAADVVIMNDDVGKIADAIIISRKTVIVAKQNITIALAVKAVILVLGALGVAGMWSAVFADVGVTLIAILNALRAMKIKL